MVIFWGKDNDGEEHAQRVAPRCSELERVSDICVAGKAGCTQNAGNPAFLFALELTFQVTVAQLPLLVNPIT